MYVTCMHDSYPGCYQIYKHADNKNIKPGAEKFFAEFHFYHLPFLVRPNPGKRIRIPLYAEKHMGFSTRLRSGPSGSMHKKHNSIMYPSNGKIAIYFLRNYSHIATLWHLPDRLVIHW